MNNRGITLQQAQDIVNRALLISDEQKTPPLAMVILDSGGHIKVISSEDNIGIQRVEIAKGKANAALGMGFNSGQFQQLVNQGVLPEMFASCINGAVNGEFIPLAGGVLIEKDLQVIGAMGISGASSTTDESIAMQAINYVMS